MKKCTACKAAGNSAMPKIVEANLAPLWTEKNAEIP
jgi:hypothetical protein